MKLTTIIPDRFYIRSKLKAKHLGDLHTENMIVVSLSPTVDPVLKSQYPKYHHFPMSDGKVTEKLLRTLRDVRDVVIQGIETGERVVVHCNAGRNRSGLVAALMLMEIYKINGPQAVAKVRALRPRAIANEHFEQFLNGFQTSQDYLDFISTG